MNYQQILALLQAKFAGVRKDGLAQLALSLIHISEPTRH